MSKGLEELKEIFGQSSIPLEDQNDLLVFLPILPESVLRNLAKVFRENPELVEEFNENFKAKFNALSGKGDKSWDEIIEEEIKESEEFPEENLEEENLEEENF